MKKVSGILFLLTLAIGAVFLACSSYENKCTIDTPEFCISEEYSDSSGQGSGDSSDSNGNSFYSSAYNPSPGYSSSRVNSTVVSSSSRAVVISSSAVAKSSVSSTPSCVYQASWCNGSPASASAVPTTATTSGSACFFVRDVSIIQGVGIKVNGVTPTANNNTEFVCGQWDKGACSSLLPAKQDGGYYIYTGQWINTSNVTTGSPTCVGGSAPGASSSATSGGGTSSASNSGGGTPSYTPTAPGSETSKLTHYWDACKPSCAWSGKGGLQANACNITGGNIGHNDMDKSSCDGGTAFMCMKNAPWKVGNVSFGYVAAAVGSCGDCYQFDFPNGQVMVVMANNHGNIHEGAKFDLMFPGGGVGDFNALTRQVQNSGVSNPDMGVQYGGFRGTCGWSYSPTAVNCVKQKCESVFANLPDLKAGCLWYVNTLGTDEASWNNPTVKYKKVTCPSELTSRY